MRSLILLLSLVITFGALAAEHRYIVPIAGYLTNPDGTYFYAYTTVQNLSTRSATIRTEAMYPLSATQTCGAPDAVTLAGRERVQIQPMLCMSAVSAMELVSSEPLIVRTELDTHQTMVYGWDKQIIDSPREWIPADVPSVSEAVLLDEQGRKANLLAINPSDQTILLKVEIERPEYHSSQTMMIEVPAKSMRFAPLSEIRNPAPPPFISSVDGRHLLRITSTGPWQGGVSSTFKGPSMYIPATPLDTSTVAQEEQPSTRRRSAH
jgi:hypothetical protein